MVDTRLALEGRPLDTATGIQMANQQANANQTQENQNAIAAQQVLQKHYQNLDAREKSRLSSTIVGAVQLKSFLDNNDPQGAQNFLLQRRQQLQNRLAAGENVDTEETDFALKALQEGNIQELQNGINGLIAAGQVYGVLKPPAQQSSFLQQFEAVKAARPDWTDAQVQDYVYTRGNVGKTTTFDNEGRIVNPAGAVEAEAERAGATKFAESQGSKAGQQVIANDTALGTLDTMRRSVSSALEQLPKVSATGPIFGRAGDAARDVEYVNLQRDLNELTLLAKDLYNLGSGQGFTDADRDFLQELVGGRYNREDSINYALRRLDEALNNRQRYLQEQSQRYQQQFSEGGQRAQSKIRVSNGTETYMIDPGDLDAALADGFTQQ